MTRHIPVTILGGYLGSGKTTTINHLLAGDHGIRIAVLVNDFGAVNVDASLIADTSDQTISLTNGCVCCSIADDLGEALDAQTARTAPPEHIVIEASGVAEPARIAAYASGWPGVALNNVVTMVDAGTVRPRASDKYVGGVVTRQIAAADLLVLNKCDLMDEAGTDTVRRWLGDRNASAPVLSTSQGNVAAETLLAPASVSGVAPVQDGHEHPPLTTRRWIPGAPVDLNELSAVLTSAPMSVHRAKGFVIDCQTSRQMLLQVAGPQIALTVAGEGNQEDGLVLIGTDPEALEALAESLGSCCNRS